MFLLLVISLIFLIIFSEIGFRLLYFLKNKKSYNVVKTNAIDLSAYQHHPYLSHIYKKEFFIKKQNLRSDYEKKINKYLFGVKTNSQGFTNGLQGDREIVIPKPENLFRISCLGASTTAHYLTEEGGLLSYPIALENLLNKYKNNKSVEANNFGIGGWNSADLLINFQLNVLDTETDLVIIYHANNDLRISLTDDFKSDYSHSKLNFSYNYSKLEILKKFINLNLHLYNYLILSFLNLKNKDLDVYSMTEKKQPNIENEFIGSNTYKRNIESIIHLCKSNNINVIISTFAFAREEIELINNYDKKFYSGLKLENQIIRDLSKKHNLQLIDNENLIPKDNKFFTDDIHFSHLGMKKIASNFADTILELIN